MGGFNALIIIIYWKLFVNISFIWPSHAYFQSNILEYVILYETETSLYFNALLSLIRKDSECGKSITVTLETGSGPRHSISYAMKMYSAIVLLK